MHRRALLLFSSSLVLLGCSSSPSGGGAIQFTASGEVLALTGYDFPPSSPGDPIFVDGWEVKFDELLVTLDAITLSENADLSATDPSRTGKAVARAKGPWAVDLHRGGPLRGKGGSDEQAFPIARIENQNLNGGEPFDETVRYAFGFDVVAANVNAKRLNLDDAGQNDYQRMIENGWAVLYVGTATWKGTDSDCKPSKPGYDFAALPGTVHFELGFASPTSYVNCQNPDNDPAQALAGEEHQRGVQVKANRETIAQATIHTDHPFWERFEHDAPAHFDQLAAVAKLADGRAVVTNDDLVGLNFTAFKDTNGETVPWRSCDPSYTPPDSAPSMHFDTGGIPYDPSGDPKETIRDYLDYMTYDQSTQGHLNSDGLCFVKRRYDSPP